MLLKFESKYAGALKLDPLPGWTNGLNKAAVEASLESAGFSNVELWTRDEAYDPQDPPGNTANLPADFPPTIANDPTASMWFTGYWSKPSGEYPAAYGLISIIEVKQGPTPKKTPDPPYTPPGPAPAPPVVEKKTPWGWIFGIGITVIVVGTTVVVAVTSEKGKR
jgi:hypothetical protein